MAFPGQSQYVIEALPRWMVSTHVNYMLPQPPGDIFMSPDDWGFQFEFQYRLQYNRPFLAGPYYSEAILSEYSLNYLMYDPDAVTDVKNKAKTNRIEAGLTAGFYPEINWLLQPYLQGRVGMAWFRTTEKIKDAETDEVLERNTVMTNNVLSYGIDLGIHIVPRIWYVRGDLRVGFVANPSVQYMTLDEDNAGTTTYPIDYFETHTSACKWIKISAGVSYMF
jgi:hypothetical protein